MKTTKIIAGISAFTMICGLGTNYININASASESVIYGDVDGDGVVQINDLTKMSLYLLHDMTFNDNQKKAADVNADGNLDLADLATIKQYIMHDDIELGKNVSDSSVGDENFNFNNCKTISKQTTMYHEFMSKYDDCQTVRIITSIKDFDEYNKLFDSKLTDVYADFNISDDFFKDNTLVVAAKAENSGSITDSITNLSIDKEKGITVAISRKAPEIGDCMMAEWHMGVVVPNKYLEGIDTTAAINIINIDDVTDKTQEPKDPDSKNDVKFDISKCNIINYKTAGPIKNLPDKIPVIIKSMNEFTKYPCDIEEISSKLKLSDEYFKDNTVIILPVTFISGSVDCKLSNVEISADKKLTLEITSVKPFIQTSDITNRHLAVSIPDKYLENVDLSKIDTNFIDKHLADPDREECINNMVYNYDYNCVSINSHTDFKTQERKLTVLNSTNYGMLDNIQIELGQEFGEICRALNISENIPEDDFYKENSLCILPCPKRSDFMGEQISGVSVDEDGLIDIQTICFDKGNTQSDSTGNILAFTISNKYLTDNQITKLNVDCWNPKTYYYDCKIVKDKYENWDSKMQGKQTSAIISSVDELNEYEKQFSDDAIKKFTPRLINFHISEEYFKENVLILAYVPESYGSAEDKITNIYLNKNNNLSVEILSSLSKTLDCNLGQYQFAISIPKKVIGNADLSSLDINYIQHSLS